MTESTTNGNGKTLYKLIGELKAQLEESQRVNAGLLENNKVLVKQMEKLGTRLTVLETQGTERRMLCDIHHKHIQDNEDKIEVLEKAVANIEGSWKTYMLVGGFSGVFGSILTLIIFWTSKGGG